MAGQPEARVGISGWVYPNWRGEFYPKGLRQADELEFASRLLTSVEVNGSFYSLQQPEQLSRSGATQTPRRLRLRRQGSDASSPTSSGSTTSSAPLANFFASGLLALQGASSVPSSGSSPALFDYDADVLEDFLVFPPPYDDGCGAPRGRPRRATDGRSWFDVERDLPLRYAVEVRSASFDVPDWAAMLSRHGHRIYPSPPTPPGSGRSSTVSRPTSPTPASTATGSSTRAATTRRPCPGGRCGGGSCPCWPRCRTCTSTTT